MRRVSVQEREAILKLHAGSLPLADDVALPALATACHGYSGADLAALCREAAMTALSDAAAAMLAGEALAAPILLVLQGGYSDGEEGLYMGFSTFGDSCVWYSRGLL